MENDYTVGGLLRDTLWEQGNTGPAERPSGRKSWATPASETVTLDHMLIAVDETPHVEGGRTVAADAGPAVSSVAGRDRCAFRVPVVSLRVALTALCPDSSQIRVPPP